MTTLIALVAAMLVLAMGSACDRGEEPPTPTAPPSPTATTAATSDLPEPVEEKRSAILAAARTPDYQALEGLLDPKTFNYSFGESGDPVGYWRRLEREGHVPVLGDIMPAVFATTPAKQGGTYVWPAAATKSPEDWNERDLADVRTLAGEEDIEQYRQAGSYLGWRAGIQAEGAWLFFVAGD